MSRELAFSVKLSDCKVETFSVGGAGGQRRDKKATGVRITHAPSGAKGQCTDHREQLRNKREAMVRMSKNPKFIYWARMAIAKFESDEDYLAREMTEEKIRVEVKDNKKWTLAEEDK